MIQIWIIFSTVLWASVSEANPGFLPEPPFFGTATDPEKALQNYPLGVITLEAAYLHHGKPDKIVLLANDKEGWVYTVGYATTNKTYRLPSGEIKSVKQTDWGLGVRNFVLVHDDKVVIDVIYKDDGKGIGITAMELQYPRPDPRGGP